MIDLPGIVRYAKGATQAQYDEARAILEALDIAYPGHPWSIEISGDDTGGRVFIRHLAFDQGQWGMNIRHTKKDNAFYSSSAFKREVIMKAGEWLERAGLRRGAYDADSPMTQSVEGVAKKKEAPMDVVIAPGDLRTTPRPQVQQEAAKAQDDRLSRSQ